MSNARIVLVTTSVVFLAALVFVLAATAADRPANAQSNNETTAPPPVRQDRVFGPPIEIDRKPVRSGKFVITYVDEEAFEADDGAIKEKDKGGREVTELLRQYARVVDFEALKGEDKAEEMETKKAELEERDDVERVAYNGLIPVPGSPYDKGKKGLPESGGVSDVALLVSGIAVALLLVVCGGIVLVRKTVR